MYHYQHVTCDKRQLLPAQISLPLALYHSLQRVQVIRVDVISTIFKYVLPLNFFDAHKMCYTNFWPPYLL